jgi:hypothetical protein
MADHLTREELVKAAADAVSLIASGAAHRQVMDPLARDISDAERDGHARLVAALSRLTSPPLPDAGDTDALVEEANQGHAAGYDGKRCTGCGSLWPCLSRRLADALAAAKQDTARLDWLDTQRWEAGDRDGNNPPDYCQWDVQGQTWDVRSAIDAARRGAQEGDTDA